MLALAEEMFADLPNVPDSPLEPAHYGGGEMRDSRQLEQVHLTMALPGLPYEDEDFYALQVLSTLFGGGMSSRLFQEARENRGLCYSIFSFASSYTDGGMLGIYAGTGADELDQLVEVIGGEFHRLADGIGEIEIERGRAQLRAGTLMSLESSSARAEQLARQLLIYGRPIPLEELVERINAVDSAAIARVVERTAAGRLSLAAMGPIATLASYDDIAAKFA
jgi:predicted Zn-dependent peptidase